MSDISDRIAFELVSPVRLLYSGDVEMVVVPGSEGDFGVLPGHAPVIATVRPGVIDIHEGGRVESRIFVAGGFAEVTTGRCTVLAEEAQPLADIEVSVAEARLKAAREAVEDADETGKAEAARELVIAEALRDALR